MKPASESAAIRVGALPLAHPMTAKTSILSNWATSVISRTRPPPQTFQLMTRRACLRADVVGVGESLIIWSTRIMPNCARNRGPSPNTTSGKICYLEIPALDIERRSPVRPLLATRTGSIRYGKSRSVFVGPRVQPLSPARPPVPALHSASAPPEIDRAQRSHGCRLGWRPTDQQSRWLILGGGSIGLGFDLMAPSHNLVEVHGIVEQHARLEHLCVVAP